MLLIPVTEISDPSLSFVKELYEGSFKLYERRTWRQLLQVLPGSRMKMELVTEEQISIGFVTWWRINGWNYIEHFAIDPAKRGKQYGSKVMYFLLERFNHRLILEVAPAADDCSKRRTQFYERMGMRIVPFHYLQPPYRKDEPGVPMTLMSVPGIIQKTVFDNIVTAIRQTVYEPFY